MPLWALYRLDAARETELTAAASDADRLVRTHAMRVLAETPRWDDGLRSLALRGLADCDPFVARAAVDAIGKHPRPAEVAPLLALWHRTPDSDVHLRHAVRLALLEMITLPGTLAHWAASGPSDEDLALMSGVALALPTDEAGAFLIKYLRTHRVAPKLMGPLLTHAAKHLPKDVDVSALAEIAQKGVAGDLDLQLDLLTALRDGLRNRSQAEPASIKEWGTMLARRLLASVAGGEADWVAFGRDGMRGQPWRIESRESADGAGRLPFLSSLPLGEKYTGTLRSREFAIPGRLSLYVCGHLGYPDQARLARKQGSPARRRHEPGCRRGSRAPQRCGPAGLLGPGGPRGQARGDRGHRRACPRCLCVDRRGAGRSRSRGRAQA